MSKRKTFPLDPNDPAWIAVDNLFAEIDTYAAENPEKFESERIAMEQAVNSARGYDCADDVTPGTREQRETQARLAALEWEVEQLNRALLELLAWKREQEGGK